MRHLAASRITKQLSSLGYPVKRTKNWVTFEVDGKPDMSFDTSLVDGHNLKDIMSKCQTMIYSFNDHIGWERDRYMQIEGSKVDLDREIKGFGLGQDGLPYAVFFDNGYSWEYDDLIGGHGIANFGGYENAVCLQSTIGL